MYDVFVTNVPNLRDVPHHTFMKMFEQYGKVVQYKIKHNKSTAVISYDNPESASQAITHLNESYTSYTGKSMFVSKRVTDSGYEIYKFLKDQKWQEAYDAMKAIYFDWSAYSDIVWKVISKNYELIACQHFALFNFINELIDWTEGAYYLSDYILILQVRKEGWFARKSAVKQVLKDYSPLADDLIDHIVIGYCL